MVQAIRRLAGAGRLPAAPFAYSPAQPLRLPVGLSSWKCRRRVPFHNAVDGDVDDKAFSVLGPDFICNRMNRRALPCFAQVFLESRLEVPRQDFGNVDG